MSKVEVRPVSKKGITRDVITNISDLPSQDLKRQYSLKEYDTEMLLESSISYKDTTKRDHARSAYFDQIVETKGVDLSIFFVM